MAAFWKADFVGDAAQAWHKKGLPAHIGMIMDGNGRWAKKKGFPRMAGHREGAKTMRSITEYCYQLGIRVVTYYAFSTENWSRPKEEVDSIMNLLREYLNQDLIRDMEVKVRFLGNRAPLAADLQEKMARMEQKTAHFDRMTLNLAVNYGGRDELVNAFRLLAGCIQRGELSPEMVDEAMISRALYTAGQPDPDLIIRPSGEQRTSNFLLWQSAYAELIFMDVLWPDFKPAHLDRALAEYSRRSRRFGGV